MKQLIWLLCVFSGAELLTSGPRQSVDNSGGMDKAAVEQQLLQMEREWSDAMVKRDASVIDRIEADDFVFTFPGGDLGNKKADLHDAKNATWIVGSVELSDMKVQVYGDAAVVIGKATLRNAKWKGKDVSGDYRFTDTFVKKAGHWQAVASHTNKVEAM
jgi:ketosteroid isomerase-like protein